MRTHLYRVLAACGAAAALFTMALMLAPFAHAQGVDISPWARSFEQTYGVAGNHIACSSGDVANTSAICTLPAGSSTQFTYITHFRCEGAGATGAAIALITVTGTNAAANMVHPMGVVAGATTILTPVDYSFDPPVASSAAATAIVITMGAFGTGNAHASCVAEGFYM